MIWKTVKINDVCLVTDYVANGSFKSLSDNVEYLTNDGYAILVRLTDFTKGWNGNYKYVDEHAYNFLAKTKLFAGDLLISNVGEPGKTFLVPELDMPMTLGPNSILVRPDNNVLNTKFFKYLIDSPYGKSLLDKITSGTTQKKFNKTGFRNLEIPLPSLTEQQRIVAKLDAAFAEIDEAKKIASSAADSANQLFKKKLSLIFLTSRSGWHNTTIVNCCQLKSGNTINKALEKTEGEIPYLKVADMNLASNVNGVITSSRFVSKADISDNALIKKGSVIFPKRGGAIATNKKRLTLTDICADLNIMSVYPQASLIPELLYYFFKNIDMAMLGSGSSIPQINNYDIEPLSISYPVDKREQLNLASKLKDIEHETERLAATYQCKVAELIKLKSAILLKELQSSEAA